MIRLTVVLSILMGLGGCSQTASVSSTAAIGPGSSKAPSGTQMVMRGYAFPPPAFRPFCAREPQLCSTVGSTKTVKLTPERMAELKAVTVSVNRRIREQSDLASTGKADDWRLPATVGDCEDFAILKKKELMERGWPASALLLTVATRGGEGHVVLTVRTDRGDFVLDNMTNAVRDWSKAPYRYFARQSQSASGKWERIGTASQPATTG